MASQENITPAFKVGQRVKAVAFTDCFGKYVPERTELIITEVRLFEGQSIPSYFRVKAMGQDGIEYVEGAERYFASAQPSVCAACDRAGILEILPCSGGAVGDIYFCVGCTIQHQQHCEDCHNEKANRS